MSHSHFNIYSQYIDMTDHLNQLYNSFFKGERVVVEGGVKSQYRIIGYNLLDGSFEESEMDLTIQDQAHSWMHSGRFGRVEIYKDDKIVAAYILVVEDDFTNHWVTSSLTLN